VSNAADETARQRVAAALQQGRGGDDLGEHPEDRHAAVERRGPAARQGAAEGTEEPAADGLSTKLPAELQGPVRENNGGGSDDIGDISWNVPTVTLNYPSNIPGLPGHNWANAISMATPIAHKGVTAGAKVQAMTILDLVMRPEARRAGVDVFQGRPDKGHQVRTAAAAAGSARSG